MSQETGVSQVSHEGGTLRVQGAHEGKKSDFRVTLAEVEAIEKKEGRKGVEAFFHRSLAGATEDKRYAPDGTLLPERR